MTPNPFTEPSNVLYDNDRSQQYYGVGKLPMK